MKISILSKKYGNQTINTEDYNPHTAGTNTPAFKIVEDIFNEWFDHSTQPGAPMGRDIIGMYEGEGDQPAIYTKTGAIRQGIENLITEAEETDKPTIILNEGQIQKFDIEAAFI